MNSANLSQLNAENEPLVMLLDEIGEKLQRGEFIDVEACVDAHPEFADQIQRLVPTLIAVANLGPDSVVGKGNETTSRQQLQSLGDFRIVRELGRGGMGIVYEAEQLSSGRFVALKVLPFAAIVDPIALQRFRNEIRAAGTLDHPNIVGVFSVGEERGIHYYAMQLVRGPSLAQVIDSMRKEFGGAREAAGIHRSATSDSSSRTDLNPETETAPVAQLSTVRAQKPQEYFRTVVEFGIQAAEALEHAHSQGVVHRDIKPGNLLLDPTGKLYVTDFGLARLENDVSMTVSGDLVGTLRYMSPEQVLGRRTEVDHRADVYSLGATLYELATLEPLFGSRDRQELLRNIVDQAPTPPSRLHPSAGGDFETILLKTVEKDPADRYASAKELADDLRRFLRHGPIHARRPSPASRAIKWVRRHPSQLLFATIALAVSLVASLASVTVTSLEHKRTTQALEEKSAALAVANQQRRRAIRNVQLARSVVDSFYSNLATQWIADDAAPSNIQQDILAEASKFYQELAETPIQEFDLGESSLAASGYDRMGLIDHYLQNYAKAAKARAKAIAIIREVLSQNPQNIDIRSVASQLYYDLGQSLIELARFEEATEAFNEGAGLASELAQQQVDRRKYLFWLSRLDLSRAIVLAQSGSLAQARQLAEAAKGDLDALRKQANSDQTFWRSIRLERFRAGYWLAKILASEDDVDAAWEECQYCLRFCRGLRGMHGHDVVRNRTLEIDLMELSAELAAIRGDLETAAQQYGHVLDMRRKSFQSTLSPRRFFMESVFKENSISMDGLIEPGPFCGYVETQQRLAQVLKRMNRPYAAEQHLGECNTVVTAIIAERPNSLRYHVAHANTWTLVAELLADRRSEDAETAYHEAKKLWTEINETFSHGRHYVSGIHSLQPDWERFQDASGLFAETKVADADDSRKDPQETVFFQHSNGRAWYSAGLWQSAIHTFKRSADLRTEGHAYDWLYLAIAHAELGEYEESDQWLERAIGVIDADAHIETELLQLLEKAKALIRQRRDAAEEPDAADPLDGVDERSKLSSTKQKRRHLCSVSHQRRHFEIVAVLSRT